MSRVEVERGRRYYCEVVGSEKPLAGTFVIDGTDIRASLIRFGHFLQPEADGYLRIRTEENWYASMFDTIPSGWTQRGSGPDKAYVQDTSSNITLVGYDVWTDNDLVRRLSFRIVGLDPLFRNSPHFRAVNDSDMAEMPDLTAFETLTNDGIVKAWLAPSGTLASYRSSEVTPWIVAQFEEGRTIANIRRTVQRITQFFSVVSGTSLRATDLIVSRYSETEIDARASSQEPIPEHRVFRYEDGDQMPVTAASPYSTLVGLWSQDERNAIEASLSAWIERDDDWASASAMMADTLSKQGIMSVSRLLSATRCLEEIPDAAPRNVISKEHARALGKLVGRGAAQLGYGAIGGRFKNAISKIALETSRERLERLVADVRLVFGEMVIDDHIVDWVAEALSMRGRAAHGARTALDYEYEVFTRAVEAVECLNILLILKGLPLGDDHRARASRYTLVRQYRNCALPGPPAAFRAALNNMRELGNI
ncbi:MAG: hypothetical protein ACSLE1_04145 [Sphingobium sp.]